MSVFGNNKHCCALEHSDNLQDLPATASDERASVGSRTIYLPDARVAVLKSRVVTLH
jgi:hypothetical protein